jgi:hypothetical protein
MICQRMTNSLILRVQFKDLDSTVINFESERAY